VAGDFLREVNGVIFVLDNKYFYLLTCLESSGPKGLFSFVEVAQGCPWCLVRGGGRSVDRAAQPGVAGREGGRRAVNADQAFLIPEWFLHSFSVSLFSVTTLYIKRAFLLKHGLPFFKQNA